jgi:hypothetical protein
LLVLGKEIILLLGGIQTLIQLFNSKLKVRLLLAGQLQFVVELIEVRLGSLNRSLVVLLELLYD